MLLGLSEPPRITEEVLQMLKGNGLSHCFFCSFWALASSCTLKVLNSTERCLRPPKPKPKQVMQSQNSTLVWHMVMSSEYHEIIRKQPDGIVRQQSKEWQPHNANSAFCIPTAKAFRMMIP
jgi:hypothetical protein